MTILMLLFIGGLFYQAHEEAFRGNSRFKLAAVIMKGGRILSIGHNYLTSDPKGYKNNFVEQGFHRHSFHAEFDAILNSNTDITGAKLLVYRFGADGSLRNSKPCERCWEAIRGAGITYCYYWDNNVLCKEKP